MNEILKKLVLGLQPTEREIYNGLYDICDAVHAGCNNECPVYECMGKVPLIIEEDGYENCSCFRNGKAMAEYIRKHYKE